MTTLPFRGGDSLIYPLTDLIYLGAFRYPDDMTGDHWGGDAGQGMGYYPLGDPSNLNADTGHPGSLFAMGSDLLVAEISIPVPVLSPAKSYTALPKAIKIQDFHDIMCFYGGEEEEAGALTYLPRQKSQTTDKLYYITFNRHKGSAMWGDKTPTHGACELNLSDSQSIGGWRIGHYGKEPSYFEYCYLIFDMDPEWAQLNTPGFMPASGGFRPSNTMYGPGLVAFGPWNDINQLDSCPANRDLSYTRLLGYVEGHPMEGMHGMDTWLGGVWLKKNKASAVGLIVNKGCGDFWYGYYPSGDKGYRASSMMPMIVFYSPFALSGIAAGHQPAFSAQPYAALHLKKYLFTGSEMKAAAFDRKRSLLYVHESGVYMKPSIIHCWRLVDAPSVAIERERVLSFIYQATGGDGFRAYPDPFRAVVHFSFHRSSEVATHTIDLYDSRGRHVDRLEAGSGTTVTWNAAGFPSGVYIARFFGTSSSFQYVKLMLLR